MTKIYRETGTSGDKVVPEHYGNNKGRHLMRSGRGGAVEHAK